MADNIIDAVKERHEHLVKMYGEHDPYVNGFEDCMNIIEHYLEERDGV